MFGLFLPFIVLIALEIALPKIGDVIEVEWVRTIGLAVLFAVGALVAITLFDNLASELARRSSF